MTAENTAQLATELQIALAHTPRSLRDPLRIFFDLDLRLARIVGATNEPMLGQMRLSWWREMMEKPVEDRPSGDKVLDGIGAHWRGAEEALVQLVNGWEQMLAQSMTEETALEFANGRAAPFVALAGGNAGANVINAARRWALVDCGIHVTNAEERELFLSLAREQGESAALPNCLRGLAILDALARRSLLKNGNPLMHGRTASLIALRAALLGK